MFSASVLSLVLLGAAHVVVFQPTYVDAWMLAQVGLNESYRVLHLSTHYSRVFLSISVRSDTFPTLIEAQWTENYVPMNTAIFPHPTLHANGDHNDCTRIQQTVWTQVDALNRLWVMDSGWRSSNGKANCPPKLLVFDLVKNNAEVLRIDCSKYLKPRDDKLLVIKMGPTAMDDCEMERFVYFLIADDSHILAYDILEQTWHRRQLKSRKYSNIQEAFPIKPIDMAFGNRSELLISDSDGSLYSSFNSLLQQEKPLDAAQSYDDNEVELQDTIELSLLGSLLGPSRGMMVDGAGALFYMVPKFGAVVRCEYKQNLTAEGNEIIFMTSKNIQQIFFGVQGSVWLLTDRWLQPQDSCYQDF